MTTRASDGAFSLGYGALERAIAGLVGADAEAVRVRFRKLRLRPFPADIRTGTGVRVRYDLGRSLALATVFELNALAFPQQTAVGMVERAWPEICRAAICAASDLGLIARPAVAPAAATAVVTILPDAFATGAAADVMAARVDDRLVDSQSTVRIDARRLVSALTADGVGGGHAEMAFLDLGARFGWASSIYGADRGGGGGGFLEDGPYFARAEALLASAAEAGGANAPLSRARVQAIVDYIATPAPVDAWKGAVGVDDRSPRLGHRLQAFAIARGYESRLPATIVSAAAGDEPGRAARELIAIARAVPAGVRARRPA